MVEPQFGGYVPPQPHGWKMLEGVFPHTRATPSQMQLDCQCFTLPVRCVAGLLWRFKSTLPFVALSSLLSMVLGGSDGSGCDGIAGATKLIPRFVERDHQIT